MSLRQITAFRVSAQLFATLQNCVDGDTIPVNADQGLTWQPPTALSAGTAANQADRVWRSTNRALTSGANEDINVYNLGSIDIGTGAGNDATGRPLVFAKIVGFMIMNKAASAGTLLVGGNGTSAAWTSPFNGSNSAVASVKPGGVLLMLDPTLAGYGVTNTTNHLLRIAATGGAATYDIVLLGRSA